MNESNNENKVENADSRPSIMRVVKKSIIPIVSLAMINALLEFQFDYKVNRLVIYGILFMITFILSIDEWMRCKANKK